MCGYRQENRSVIWSKKHPQAKRVLSYPVYHIYAPISIDFYADSHNSYQRHLIIVAVAVTGILSHPPSYTSTGGPISIDHTRNLVSHDCAVRRLQQKRNIRL
jgi:hypothetical protein